MGLGVFCVSLKPAHQVNSILWRVCVHLLRGPVSNRAHCWRPLVGNVRLPAILAANALA